MDIRFADRRPATAYALAIPVRSGQLDRALGDLAGSVLKDAAAAQRFDGESGSVVESYVAVDGATRRVLLVGIGKSDPSATEFEKLGATLAGRLLTSETTLVVDLTTLGLGAAAAAAAAVASGARLRGWRYDKYRTKLPERQKPSLKEVVIVGGGGDAAAAWSREAAIADGVEFTRMLVTEPANIVYPESFVALCREAFAGTTAQIEVLGEDQMRELGMGALLGVSQGSRREAQLLAIKYDGTGGAVETPVAFVGKGVTFDTGGISIKPAAGMEDMKWDMGGAGAVAGAMLALARRNAKVHVVGVCGLVENMPDGDAQRPGDVVTSMSGQTIEVINTDAEGRLVLCDAICWVQQRFKPKTIVDLATLTGAMIIALGHEHGGLFANSDNLAEQLSAAGSAVGEPLWRFPLSDAYDKLIDSPIADMKNVGPRPAGSITAAQFIKRFVNDGVEWAHLDIAGMAWAAKAGHVWDKGATGYGVRLLDRFAADVLEGAGTSAR